MTEIAVLIFFRKSYGVHPQFPYISKQVNQIVSIYKFKIKHFSYSLSHRTYSYSDSPCDYYIYLHIPRYYGVNKLVIYCIRFRIFQLLFDIRRTYLVPNGADSFSHCSCASMDQCTDKNNSSQLLIILHMTATVEPTIKRIQVANNRMHPIPITITVTDQTVCY